MKNEWNIDLYINASKYMQDLYKHLTTHNDFSAHYIRCFFQHCFFLEMEFAGIFSAVLKENVSEMDLETVNEETANTREWHKPLKYIAFIKACSAATYV